MYIKKFFFLPIHSIEITKLSLRNCLLVLLLIASLFLRKLSNFSSIDSITYFTTIHGSEGG